MRFKILEGKNCLVTGGARGIGKSIVKRFLEEGGNVVFCDVNEELGKQTERELSKLGKIHFLKADVSDEEEVRNLVNSSLNIFNEPQIDVLVNNAGISKFEMMENISIESWNRIISVDLTGTFLVSKEVINIMKKKGGSIVNVSSTNGILGEAGLAHYNAAKAGIILLSKTMALELATYHIRVNSICPGFILTDIQREANEPEERVREYVSKIPIGRLGTPDDVSSAVLFLASDEASFISGTELVVDGGQICKE